jgi:hypothetical protein
MQDAGLALTEQVRAFVRLGTVEKIVSDKFQLN